MSSLKMTFSLASLVLLMAFIAMPVMAHNITEDADNDPATAETDVTGHAATDPAHPVVKSVTLLGDAADGYVNNDSYVVEVKFEVADIPNGISVPTSTTVVGLESTPSGAITSTVDTHKINDTTYRIRISSSSATTGDEYAISVEGGSENIYTPDAPETGDDPARATVTYDSMPPTVMPGTAQPIAGKAFPLNNELEEAFDVVFVIADEAVSGTDSTAMTLDGTSFELMADPDTVTFSNIRYLGANKFAATVTPKAVTADETAATSVTITASVMDKAGNSNVGTAMVTLAARMADGTGTGTDVDPPTATITVSDHMTSGVKGTFNVRVEFTPATGGSAVMDFDHSGLSVVDSSTPAKTVSVTPVEGTEANPIAEPLIADNLYVATLEYDTRFNFTLPLTVTISQSVVETDNPTESDTVGTALPTPPTPDTRQVITLTIGSDVKSLTRSGTYTIDGERQYEIEGEIGPRTGGIELGTLTSTANFDPWDVFWERSHNGNDSFQRRNNEWRFVGDVEATTGHYALSLEYDRRSTHKLQVSDDPTTVTSNDAIALYRFYVRVDRLGPTLRSIGVSDGVLPEAGGPFRVTLSFDEPLSATPTDAGFSVKNGAISDIIHITGSHYSAIITPNAGVAADATDATKRAVEVRLNAGLMDEHGNPSIATAATATADGSFSPRKATTGTSTPPTPGDITAAYAEGTGTTTGTTTISEGVIAANDFVVIDYTDLPDLELFFDIGGTIGLNNGDATADANSRTVVISEILWGLDFGEEVLADQQKHQFIELYNTTAADIDLADWELVFTRGNVVPASDIDQVSNRGISGWEVDTGDTGKSGRVAETLADDATSTITPINIISMYRNINYDKVEKVKADGTADPNRAEQLKGIPGGNAIGSWKNSELRSTNRWIYSTPGSQHHKRVAILTASSVAGTPFVINEFGNDSGGDNDWVELHNRSDAAASLKNYQLTAVTANDTDTELFDFLDQDWKVPAKGYIVISTRHPRDTDLATGKDISVPDDEELNKGLKHLYVVKSGWNLPDDGKFALILRSAHDKQKTDANLIDVVATRQGAFSATNTRLWPLKLGGLPHENVIDAGGENFAAGKVYQRNGDGSNNGRGDKSLAVAVYTGIGYNVKASKVSSNHGTPGYANDAAKANLAGIGEDVVTISEIMTDVGDSPRRNLPQWIELHNASHTLGVNLSGWKVHIENAAQADGDLETNTFSATITLGAKYILPNQTLLIASRSGDVRDPNHFPTTRVIDLWTTKAHRDALEMAKSTDPVLSTTGFNITLVDKDGAEIDEVGNLDGDRRTRDEPTWALPMSEDPTSRSSLIRVYDDGVALDGTAEASWILASDTILAFERSQAYYGDSDDVGTPGYRTGGPLPVSLSKFRPERLESGEIVVRWITESELNNAGFNILRSETRDGQFTQMNTSLIAGQGTTSERTTYEWKDSTAKPNVVYYYQIQDVSLDGQVQTLRQSRLKGHVSAAGKLTTTWGELKALQ